MDAHRQLAGQGLPTPSSRAVSGAPHPAAKKVPKPESYKALVAAAQGMVGHSKDVRLFHAREQELRQEHVRGLKDGDVIYVKADARPAQSAAVEESVYRNDFVRHALDNGPMRKEVRREAPLPFQGESSYAAEYIAHDVQRAPRVEAARWEPKPGRFEGKSQYKDDFTPKPIPPSVPAGPSSAQAREYVTFEGVSTYADSYIPRSCPPAEKPVQQPPKAPLPFVGRSQYKDDFVPLPAQQGVPQNINQHRQWEALPFQGASTYAQDYLWMNAPRQEHVHLVPIESSRGMQNVRRQPAHGGPQHAGQPSSQLAAAGFRVLPAGCASRADGMEYTSLQPVAMGRK